jgi:poly(hydroxyalkanoate) depolymerase family esterase
MAGIDWRELFAANQATIRAGLSANRESGFAPPDAVPSGLARDPPAAANPGARRRDERRALVYVPSGLTPAIQVPLVCLLHGCTQDPAAFAAATLMNDFADRHGFVVVYPGQDRASNPQGCWNWFLPEHQRRGTGEPAAIAGIIRDLVESDAQCTIDPERVFVAGLSSGGAMAATLSACYPELFAAVAIHSGLPYRSAMDMPSALQAMAGSDRRGEDQGHAANAAMEHRSRPIPSIVIHGKADRTVAPVNAIRVLRQSMSANHLAAPKRCNHDLARPTNSWRSQGEAGYTYTRSQWIDGRGILMHELLEIDRLGHAWSGGAPGGSYTDPRGPSATEAICTFFSLNARPY